MPVQYACTVCTIIRTICRYMYSDYGLPIILHQKKILEIYATLWQLS